MCIYTCMDLIVQWVSSDLELTHFESSGKESATASPPPPLVLEISSNGTAVAVKRIMDSSDL